MTHKPPNECVGWHRPIPDDQLTDTQRNNNITHGVPGEPIWCEKHAQRIRNNLLELPDLYLELEVEATEGTSKPKAGKISGSKHHPSPSPRFDDADEIARWACDWEDVIRRELREPASRHTATGKHGTLWVAVDYLATRLDRALAITGDIEHLGRLLGQEINTRHAQLQRQTSRDRLIHQLDAPCPACEMRTLRRADGDDLVHCANRECNAVWSEVEYERLTLVLASEAK